MIPMIPTSILFEALPTDRNDTNHELSGLVRMFASLERFFGGRSSARRAAASCQCQDVLTADSRSDLTTAS